MAFYESFNYVVHIIDKTCNNANRKVNEELILLSNKIGQFLSKK